MRRLAVILVVVGLTGCVYEPEIVDLVEHMVVQTQYSQEEITDSENIFNSYSTFTLRRDTLGYVFALSEDTVLVDGKNSTDFAKPVTSAVETNVEARGFTRVAEDADPDFAVNIVVLRDFSFSQSVTYPGYYSGYYNYYGYYSPVVTNHYSDYATLVIEVVDIANATNNQNKIIWRANIGDLLTTTDLKLKTLEAIDQAFKQSPYFTAN